MNNLGFGMRWISEREFMVEIPPEATCCGGRLRDVNGNTTIDQGACGVLAYMVCALLRITKKLLPAAASGGLRANRPATG